MEAPIDQGALKREQKYLSLLLEELKGEEVPIIFTVFSPITTANKLCEDRIQEFVKEGYGKQIHHALQKITNTTCKLVEKVIEMGGGWYILCDTDVQLFRMQRRVLC